jgi:hypothetical protein
MALQLQRDETRRISPEATKMNPRAIERLLTCTTVVLFALMATPRAEAAPLITFDDLAGQTGTVSYATLGGTLVGTNITFDSIVATGTAADGPYDCQTCRLNFTSGPNTDNGPSDDPDPYQWAGGGSFVLTGGSVLMGIDPGYTDATCDDDLDDSDCVPTTVLLSGTFTNLPGNVGVGAGSTFLFISAGIDTKNADLAAFLGIDPLLWSYAESNLSLQTVTFNSDGTFEDALVTDADLNNIKVPEPASSLLLLLGIGSLAAYYRRRA